ncbi:hypothetical protein D6817_04640 [Candidatus Pacearchaeota archaeon]|nr:MAG: hypothetical protein D6817_04640 [Candidatus Pacearchaeota archaeon]
MGISFRAVQKRGAAFAAPARAQPGARERTQTAKDPANLRPLSFKLLALATTQALSRALGYDEASLYYSLLTNNCRASSEFSHAKRYRLMNSLYAKGALAKIRSGNSLTYALLPILTTETEIMSHLLKLYTEKQLKQFSLNYTQLFTKSLENLALLLALLSERETKLSFNPHEKNKLQKVWKHLSALIPISLNLANSKNSDNLGLLDNRVGVRIINIGVGAESEYVCHIIKDSKHSSKLVEEIKKALS